MLKKLTQHSIRSFLITVLILNVVLPSIASTGILCTMDLPSHETMYHEEHDHGFNGDVHSDSMNSDSEDHCETPNEEKSHECDHSVNCNCFVDSDAEATFTLATINSSHSIELILTETDRYQVQFKTKSISPPPSPPALLTSLFIVHGVLLI